MVKVDDKEVVNWTQPADWNGTRGFRQRMLRMDQNSHLMAMNTAIAVFLFFVVAAVALSFVIKPDEWR